MAAILISIISNSYYGMLRGKLICTCPCTSHNVFWNNRNQNGHRICKKVCAYGILLCNKRSLMAANKIWRVWSAFWVRRIYPFNMPFFYTSLLNSLHIPAQCASLIMYQNKSSYYPHEEFNRNRSFTLTESQRANARIVRSTKLTVFKCSFP